jgi:hypothetical protein
MATRRKTSIPLSEEDRLQSTVVQHWRLRGARGSVLAAIPNGGARAYSTAARLKACGVLSGVPDLMAVAQSRVSFIELKAKRGRLSPAQTEIIARLREAGVEVLVSKDLGEVLVFLEARGVLKPEARI